VAVRFSLNQGRVGLMQKVFRLAAARLRLGQANRDRGLKAAMAELKRLAQDLAPGR